MLFGDDALYYQIVHDAHDPDPAVVWRNRPFTRAMARTGSRNPRLATPDISLDRLAVGMRALAQRLQPHPIPGAVCCVPAY